MVYNLLQGDCSTKAQKVFVASLSMDDVETAAAWLRKERGRLGWSTTEVARQARFWATTAGEQGIKLPQQSISQLENLQLKTLPRWFRYVRFAIEHEGLGPEERMLHEFELTGGRNPNGTDERFLIPEEAELLDFFNTLPPDDQKLLLAEIRAGEAVPFPREVAAERLGMQLIPEIDMAFGLGATVVEDHVPTRMVPFRREWLQRLTRGQPADVFLTQGRGDSMIPTILDGDDVLVNRAERQIRDQDLIWALGYGDLAQIKRVRRLASGRYQLNSDNPNVGPIDATEDELFVVGRVIWIGRRM